MKSLFDNFKFLHIDLRKDVDKNLSIYMTRYVGSVIFNDRSKDFIAQLKSDKYYDVVPIFMK